MGAAGQDFTAIAQRVAGSTGGIGFGAGATSRIDDPEKLVCLGNFSAKFLDANIEPALAVLRDLMFELDGRDLPRLKDVLLQARAHQRTRLVSEGMTLALRHAARGANLEGHLNEILTGIPQVHLFEKLADAPLDPLVDRIDAIRKFLLNRRRVTVSFTGSPALAQTIRNRLTQWLDEMDSQTLHPAPLDFTPWEAPPREGLAAPMNVAYCTASMPTLPISDPDGPALAVAARLLGLGYVLEEVRFKGTAYGGGCSYNGIGRLWTFHSYRDPWVNRTLDVYAGSLDYVKSAPWTQGDVDRAIIGTAKEGERPIRPAQATGMALSRYLLGDTPQRREQRHAAMLGVTLADVRRLLIRQLEENSARAAICVVSSRQKLEEANTQCPGSPLQITDILPSANG
jgi:Zn-dependent M16 (insulinase) family peptidase